MPKPDLVSTPKQEFKAGQKAPYDIKVTDSEYRKGEKTAAILSRQLHMCEVKGSRKVQEDAVTASSIPQESLSQLKPVDIGYRLWTMHHLLDEKASARDEAQANEEKNVIMDGQRCTASTTVYDGKGNLITATLGDSAAFAVVYGEWGEVIGVARLNSVMHTPAVESEKKRIFDAGGFTTHTRVLGGSLHTRAIGDKDYNIGSTTVNAFMDGKQISQDLLLADSTIDITSLEEIQNLFSDANVNRIDVINCCDGYVDAAGRNARKEVQGQLLLRGVQLYQAYSSYHNNNPPQTLAQFLVGQVTGDTLHENEFRESIYKIYKEKMLERGLEPENRDKLFQRKDTGDNISIVVQNVMEGKEASKTATLVGVYDGHGGSDVSSYAAENAYQTFNKQCRLQKESYNDKDWSVAKKQKIYDRDHEKTPSIQADARVRSINAHICEIQGDRKSQEDAVTVSKIPPMDLEPEDIGHRLWTTHRLLDKKANEKVEVDAMDQGCTASTTVYDGKGNLITATLGDTAAFAVVYGEGGNVIGVTRLNSVMHTPEVESEKKRIIDAGGIFNNDNRFLTAHKSGSSLAWLNIARAIGDRAAIGDSDLAKQTILKRDGLVPADSTIDITSLEDIQNLYSDASVNRIDVINCCDGYVDAAGKNASREEQGQLLLRGVQLYQAYSSYHHNKPPQTLAQFLVGQVIGDTLQDSEFCESIYKIYKEKMLERGLEPESREALFDRRDSHDNISIVVQNVMEGKEPGKTATLVGVYDGHGGSDVSSYAAENVSQVFNEQCRLQKDSYNDKDWSVAKKQEIYDRDHANPPSIQADARVATAQQQQETHTDSTEPETEKEARPVGDAVEKQEVPTGMESQPENAKLAIEREEEPKKHTETVALSNSEKTKKLTKLRTEFLNMEQKDFNYFFSLSNTLIRSNRLLIGRRLEKQGVTGDLFESQQAYDDWQAEIIAARNEQAKTKAQQSEQPAEKPDSTSQTKPGLNGDEQTDARVTPVQQQQEKNTDLTEQDAKKEAKPGVDASKNEELTNSMESDANKPTQQHNEKSPPPEIVNHTIDRRDEQQNHVETAVLPDYKKNEPLTKPATKEPSGTKDNFNRLKKNFGNIINNNDTEHNFRNFVKGTNNILKSKGKSSGIFSILEKSIALLRLLISRIKTVLKNKDKETDSPRKPPSSGPGGP